MNAVEAARRMTRRWQAMGIGRPDGLVMGIQATRVGIAALGRVGIEARPLPCGITVFNHAALRLHMQGVPTALWPEEARSVTVSPALANPGPGWNGHLLIEHDELICDLALGAFSRQDCIQARPTVWVKGIDLVPVDTEHGLAWVSHRPDDPFFVRMDPKPHLTEWRRGPAWRQDPPAAWVDELVAAMTGPDGPIGQPDDGTEQ